MSKPIDFITPAEIQVVLGMSETTVYQALARGDIPARQIGRRWFIVREVFNDWLMKEAAA